MFGYRLITHFISNHRINCINIDRFISISLIFTRSFLFAPLFYSFATSFDTFATVHAAREEKVSGSTLKNKNFGHLYIGC